MTKTTCDPESACLASPYGDALGMEIISATRDEVTARMRVTQVLSNRNGVLHGGAIMGFADNTGGTVTILNLPEGMTTTTLESKTNFLRPIHVGDTAHARTTTLHSGRTTMIVQTTITRDDGKVAAIVTQTQMILAWKPSSA